MVVAGSEVEGLYGLLRGAISHSSMSSGATPPKRTHHTPTATISHPPPQEPKGAVPEASNPVTEGVKQALKAVSQAAPEVLEVAIPANMTPLCLQLGGIKRVYKCWVEGCKEGLLTSCATICTHEHRLHLGVGLTCSFCAKTFLNPDTLRHHKKSHLPQ